MELLEKYENYGWLDNFDFINLYLQHYKSNR